MCSMEKLHCLNTLYGILKSNVTDLVPAYPKMVLGAANKHNDLPHILMHGRSSLVMHYFVQEFLSRYYGEEVDMNRAAKVSFSHGRQLNIPFRSSRYFSDIDLGLTTSNNDRLAFCALVEAMTDHMAVYGNKRQVVVLRNIERVPEHMEASLRNLLDDYSTTTLFLLLSCSGVSKTQNMVGGRVMVVNVHCNAMALLDMLAQRMGCCEISSATDAEKRGFLERCQHDPVNMCLLMQVQSPLSHRGNLFAFVFDSMVGLTSSRASLHTNQDQINEGFIAYTKLLREFAVKVGAACVPLNELSKTLIAVAGMIAGQWHDDYDEIMQHVVSMLSDMEHMSCVVNKNIFVLERYLDRFAMLFSVRLSKNTLAK